MMQYWSWVLAVIGVTGIFFVGRKTIWGWHILCINECLWITYAIITKQYGFIFSALAYAAVYVKSYMLWRKEGDPSLDTPKSVRRDIVKGIEALPIKDGLTNAVGMKMMAVKVAKSE
jgi:nicotinamide riboside transporter PnuC